LIFPGIVTQSEEHLGWQQSFFLIFACL
jgi:hypothetical protein